MASPGISVEKKSKNKSVYINKHSGVLKLFVNGYLLTSKRFKSIPERRLIQNDWLKAFENIHITDRVYMELSHYEMTYLKKNY